MGLLKQLSGNNYISVNKTMIKLFGLEEAVMLGELCFEYDYWETENKLIDGAFFYCTIAKMEENTGLTEYQQRKAIKSLENAGIIKTCLKGIPATRYFEIVEDKLLKNLTSSSEKTKELVPKKLSSSNNIYNKNKNNNTISKDIVENSRLIPKPNLYSKCVALIHDYTTNDELSKALIEYLKVRLEMKDKPLYVNSWKGLLNKLDREFDEHERLSVVYQSIERGYASFFPVNTSKSNNTARDIEHLTESNPRGNKEKLKEDIANGNVTRF